MCNRCSDGASLARRRRMRACISSTSPSSCCTSSSGYCPARCWRRLRAAESARRFAPGKRNIPGTKERYSSGTWQIFRWGRMAVKAQNRGFTPVLPPLRRVKNAQRRSICRSLSPAAHRAPKYTTAAANHQPQQQQHPLAAVGAQGHPVKVMRAPGQQHCQQGTGRHHLQGQSATSPAGAGSCRAAPARSTATAR